jgi:hypothetical protein
MSTKGDLGELRKTKFVVLTVIRNRKHSIHARPLGNLILDKVTNRLEIIFCTLWHIYISSSISASKDEKVSAS